MEVNNTNNSQILLNDTRSGLQNPSNQNDDQAVEEKAGFGDAAKIDLTDPNAKKADRELSNETQQFLANNGVELAKESASFDKQSVLAVSGSMTAAQGHANAVTTRALLS